MTATPAKYALTLSTTDHDGRTKTIAIERSGELPVLADLVEFDVVPLLVARGFGERAVLEALGLADDLSGP